MSNINPQHLFVYGLLRKKAKHPMANQLMQHASWKGEGYVYGLLYDIGNYPGVLSDPDEKNKVIGDIYQINNPAIFKQLDRFEGIGPGFTKPYEYERKTTKGFVNAIAYDCWIYIYNWSVNGRIRIQNGDYLSWIKS